MSIPAAKEEALEQTAESIATRGLPFSAFRNEQEWKDTKAWIANEVLSALRNERERGAKIAETSFEEFQTGYNAGIWIAAAIRGRAE